MQAWSMFQVMYEVAPLLEVIHVSTDLSFFFSHTFFNLSKKEMRERNTTQPRELMCESF
jgi:hypothetical protein